MKPTQSGDWPKSNLGEHLNPPSANPANRSRQAPGVAKVGARTQNLPVVTLPERFIPRFWKDCDQRASPVRFIHRRYDLLKEHTHADSIQKDLLCQRAAFLSLILETWEVRCAENLGMDLGSYVQACNALSGLLKALGLSKQLKNVTDLQTYLKEKES